MLSLFSNTTNAFIISFSIPGKVRSLELVPRLGSLVHSPFIKQRGGNTFFHIVGVGVCMLICKPF